MLSKISNLDDLLEFIDKSPIEEVNKLLIEFGFKFVDNQSDHVPKELDSHFVNVGQRSM